MRRPLTALVTTAVGATALVVLPAVGPVAPAAAAVRDQSLSALDSSMWQTDDPVTSLAYSPATGLVYAAGSFTRVRPPGVAEGGAGEVTRTYLAAFSATTGVLATTFDVAINGQPNDLAVSADGGTLFLGGEFTSVDGQTRQRLAAVDATTGTLETGFTADADGVVTAIAVQGAALYASGRFSTINGTGKTRLARLDATSGAVQGGFTASLDAAALALDLAPVTATSSRLLAGGSFTTVNGAQTGGMTSLDPASGVVQAWAANASQPINTRCTGRVTDIDHTATVPATVVVSGEGDAPGCWEGTYAAAVTDGRLLWNSPCLGATQGVAVIGSLVYKGSHQHDCGYARGDARGGFVGSVYTSEFQHWNLQSQSLADGSFQHWTPDTNSGVTTDEPGAIRVGPRAMLAVGSSLVVGGDFTQINGGAQQGLARFGPGSQATPATPETPTVRSTAAGTVRVTWPATYDEDSGTLTYRLYRDSTLVSTQTAESWPWTRPMMRFDDVRPAGSTATYTVTASDGTHTSARSPGAVGSFSAFRPASYAATVDALDPVLYYRMDNSIDSSGRGHTMLSTGTSTARPAAATGAVGPGRGLSLSGGAYLTSSTPLTLTAFSQAIWFRTTSTTGGTLMAMSTARLGAGGTTDRGLLLDNNGDIAFQLRVPGTDPLGPSLTAVRQQGPTFRDNRWHLAVGVYTGSAAYLYVDGQQMAALVISASASGTPMYPRIGYVDTTDFDSVFGINYDDRAWPATPYVTGVVDDAALFDRGLTADEVRRLYAAGVSNPATTTPPAPPVTPPAPPSVASTCFGRKPTIVDRDGGTVRGTRRADVIIVAANRVTRVLAKGGADRVCGATRVSGGPGRDRIGNRGGTQPSVERGGGGDDLLVGGSGADVLSGGRGRDVLRGGRGGDTLSGGAQADRLVGFGGNDLLRGGPGRDVGKGGPGRDRCVGVERSTSCP